MPMSNDPNAYPVEKQVFEAALANNGCRYVLDNERKAKYFRHRMNKFRSLVSKHGNPRYSSFILRIEGNIIFVEPAQGLGVLTNLDGTALTFDPASHIPQIPNFTELDLPILESDDDETA